jgi:hypothetical protein
MAARIAAGAGAAVAAVAAARASLQAAGGAPASAADDALLGAEPADYLARLESLAGDDPR